MGHSCTVLHTRQNAANMLNKALAKKSNGDVIVYYLDKEKASQLLNAIGVQFPGGFNTPNGSVRSITDSKSNVKSKFQSVTQTQQFKRWFGKWDTHPEDASMVINEDGTPKIVYHGTDADFTVFERGDIGYHVGTEAQAEDRISDTENGHVMKLYADVKNPLHAAFDFGDWHSKNVAGMLIETEQFEDFDNRAEIEDRLSEIMNMKSESEADTALTKYLKKLGYDGIIYENQFEDDGESYIVFDSNQLKSATDNIGTFDKDNGDIRYSKQLDIDGKEFVKVDDTTIDENNPKDIVKALKQIAESKGFYNMEINGQKIGLSNKRGINEWVFSQSAASLYKNNRQAFDDKMQSFQNADELLETAKSYINEEAIHKKKFDNFARGDIRFKVRENGYVADILVGIKQNQSAELYDIVNITPIKITEVQHDSVVAKATQIRDESSVDSSVPQTNTDVNTDLENSSNPSSTDIRYSKELMTAEEKQKLREAERAAYLERQLVTTSPFGGKAKAISPTAKSAIAKKLASGMPGFSTSQVREQLTNQ